MHTTEPYQLCVLRKDEAPEQAALIVAKAIEHGYWTKFNVHPATVTVTVYCDDTADFISFRAELGRELPQLADVL